MTYLWLLIASFLVHVLFIQSIIASCSKACILWSQESTKSSGTCWYPAIQVPLEVQLCPRACSVMVVAWLEEWAFSCFNSKGTSLPVKLTAILPPITNSCQTACWPFSFPHLYSTVFIQEFPNVFSLYLLFSVSILTFSQSSWKALQRRGVITWNARSYSLMHSSGPHSCSQVYRQLTFKRMSHNVLNITSANTFRFTGWIFIGGQQSENYSSRIGEF